MGSYRRRDIDAETRLNIAIMAYLHQGIYGTITRLADSYQVSRKFIYQQLHLIYFAFILETTTPPLPAVLTFSTEQFIDQMIMLLRLEGNCSLHQISNILSALGVTPHSVGTISQRLQHYAGKLANTLTSETIQMVMFLSDELFANSQPILITIEPRSVAILRIELATDRRAESWKQHWTVIEQNQFYCLGLCSDRGSGLKAGFQEFDSDAPHSFDLFHDLRDLSHACLVGLEKEAYKAIAWEYERGQVLNSARSDQVITKRIEDYEQAVQQTQKTIARYDQAYQLFRRLQQELEVFDKSGQCKDRTTVCQKLEEILHQLGALGDKNLTQIVNELTEQLPTMLHYLDQAKQVVERLNQTINNSDLCNALCLAWQWNNKVFQAKTAQKKFAQDERDFWLLYVKALLSKRHEF